VLSSDPVWVEHHLSDPPPTVQAGCPTTAAFLIEGGGGPAIADDLFSVVGRAVTQPSYFRIHVIVLPQEDIDLIAGDAPWSRLTAEELVCEGHTCHEVTGGVYFGTEDVLDVGFVAAALADAIGLN